VVSGRYAVPAPMNEKIILKRYRDAYLDLYGASDPASRRVVEALRADGLRPVRAQGDPFDIYTRRGGETFPLTAKGTAKAVGAILHGHVPARRDRVCRDAEGPRFGVAGHTCTHWRRPFEGSWRYFLRVNRRVRRRIPRGSPTVTTPFAPHPGGARACRAIQPIAHLDPGIWNCGSPKPRPVFYADLIHLGPLEPRRFRPTDR
jgi:hypothetical protein